MQKILEAVDSGDFWTAEQLTLEWRRRPGLTPDQRSAPALALANAYFDNEMLAEAEAWALRAQQGNFVWSAAVLLGEIAWARMDYQSAIGWMESANAYTRRGVLDTTKFNSSARLREMSEMAAKRCRPMQWNDGEIDTSEHAIVMQSVASRQKLREQTLKSMNAAGIEDWNGPKLLVIDGGGEGPDSWQILQTTERRGQAKTYFQALQAALDCGAKRITFFEDDVVFAENAFNFIARVVPLPDAVAPVVAWWNRMAGPFRVGPPFFFLTENCSFVRNVALSMSAEVAYRILSSDVVRGWTDRHYGDMIYADALPGSRAALAFPGIVQHVGDDSTVGKVEIRKSCSFIGEKADALQLFR